MAQAVLPSVSVILPVYNGIRYLAESVASIRSQTLSDWELIIVDDASTDTTPEVIAELCALDGRIRSIRHPKNRRLPAALNTGLTSARGAYLTWTSDDNCYRPDALREMRAVLEARRDVSLVYTDYLTVDEVGVRLSHVTVGSPEDLIERNSIGACFLFRNNVFSELHGYDETLFLTEDYDFWLRAASRFRFAVLHKDLYLYRQHGQSLTRTRLVDIIKATDELLETRIPGLTWIRRPRRAAAFLALAQRARQRSEVTAGTRLLAKAFLTAPWSVLRDPRTAPLLVPRFGYKVAKLISLLARTTSTGTGETP